MSLADAVIRSERVPGDLIAELPDSSELLGQPERLRERFHADGFLFLRGVLDPTDVAAARTEVLDRLTEVDEIEPGSDGVFTDRSSRDDIDMSRGDFWRSVSTGDRLRHVSHGARIAAVIAAVLGCDVTPLDYLMLRVGVPGRTTEVHVDAPFFTRYHDDTVTVWTPIGSVPVALGPLYVVEGSHRFADRVEAVRGVDVAGDSSARAAYDESAVELARQRGARVLTTDYAPGDALMFGMFTAHGSFEHHDSSGRVRVSCDARWQPAHRIVDPRYMEPDVTGTTGAGYGELNGAKPLTEEWHVR